MSLLVCGRELPNVTIRWVIWVGRRRPGLEERERERSDIHHAETLVRVWAPAD